MIRPALALTVEQPPLAPRFAVLPDDVEPFAILDNGRPVAWAASQHMADRIAGFLNWRDQMETVERRYAEILHA